MAAIVTRHRSGLLVGVLLFALVLAVREQQKSLRVYEQCTLLTGVLVAGLLVGALIAHGSRRRPAFRLRDGGFAVPPDAVLILSVAMSTVLAVQGAGALVLLTRLNFGFRLGWFTIVPLVLAVLLLPLAWYRALGPFGAVLRPDGLLDRQPLGSLFVPWEAGPSAVPTAAGVRLRFARPELLQRRGFRPGATIRTGADRRLTAWAIDLYANRPDQRPAIGTDNGLRLLNPR